MGINLGKIALLLVGTIMVMLAMVLMAFTTAVSDTLPPRPTLTPTPIIIVEATPTPLGETDEPAGPMVGGTIQLRTDNPTNGLWTAVQWQDGHGDWHTVTGWQGGFDAFGYVTWWVAPEDLATGPFRWQLLAGEEGEVLAVSQPFYLPASSGQQVVVYIAVSP